MLDIGSLARNQGRRRRSEGTAINPAAADFASNGMPAAQVAGRPANRGLLSDALAGISIGRTAKKARAQRFNAASVLL